MDMWLRSDRGELAAILMLYREDISAEYAAYVP
jgi:hypothetical protein